MREQEDDVFLERDAAGQPRKLGDGAFGQVRLCAAFERRASHCLAHGMCLPTRVLSLGQHHVVGTLPCMIRGVAG